MSLNKIPPIPGGEDVGYDLRLNVGCDALKCNTINGETYPPNTNNVNVVQIPTSQLGNNIDTLDLTNVYLAYGYNTDIKESCTISTITQGSYHGQQKKIQALRNTEVRLVNGNAPIGNGKTIICDGGSDIIIYPTQPNGVILEIVLVYDAIAEQWLAKTL